MEANRLLIKRKRINIKIKINYVLYWFYIQKCLHSVSFFMNLKIDSFKETVGVLETCDVTLVQSSGSG